MHECPAEKKISEKFQPRLQLVPHTQTAVKHEQGYRYRLSTNVLPGVDIQFVYVKKYKYVWETKIIIRQPDVVLYRV